MQLLHPKPLWNFLLDQAGFKKQKTSIYEISRMLFYNMNYNFAHFANFNFAHFEIEESFGLIWVKLQNGWFDLQTSILSIYEVLVWSMGFIFAHFVYEGSFGQIWVRITEWSISNRFENFHFAAHFTNCFVHFEYKKVFWLILVKFIVYRVFPSSSRSNKKQFQLVDLVIGRL